MGAGPLYVHTEFELSYLGMWWFCATLGILCCNVGAVLVQDTEMYFEIEK